MGEIKIDNGLPNVHCGNPEPHDRHDNSNPTRGAGWCDGVPLLEPFLELAVRVPLTGRLAMEGTHEEVLRDILEEGLGTYVWDELDNPDASKVLRLRVAGRDNVYPLVWEDYALVVKRDAGNE